MHKNVLLGLRRKKKEQSRYDKARQIVFIVSVFISILIIAGIYFISDISNIYRITVRGNRYLSDEDVIRMSGLSTGDKYLLTIPFAVEKNVRTHDLIDTCKVRRLDGRLVEIQIEEKQAIAYQEKADGRELILAGNERMTIGDADSYLVNYVPLIEGFDDEQMELIFRNLEGCDYKVINEISEIRNYPDLKYQNVQLIMRDGNYIFTSPYGLEILDHYYSIQSSYVSNRQVCYYFEDISGNAYSSACPWEVQPEEEQDQQIEDEEDDIDEE